MQLEREHRELWAALVERTLGQHAAEVSRLEALVAAREHELAERPEREVVRYVDGDVVADARAEAERSFASRENAWQALVEVRLLHHEREPGTCRCGLPIDRCDVALIVDRYPALRAWEDEQLERLRLHKTHRLPDNHPAVLDRRRTG